MITSNISSAPFSLFFYWQSYYMHVIPSVIVPQFLNILFHFFILLFFRLQFGNFLLTYLQADSSLGSVLVTSLPASRSKLFFVLSQCFYFQHFLLVLRASKSLLTLSGSCVLCTFPISALALLTMVILIPSLIIPKSLPHLSLFCCLLQLPRLFFLTSQQVLLADS